MTGLALLLLIFQRDLGTAAIFLFLYAIIVYSGTGDQRVLIFSLLVLILAAIVGYALFDVVDLRVDAWLNPWLDPSGRSYQIVQSLLAVANGWPDRSRTRPWAARGLFPLPSPILFSPPSVKKAGCLVRLPFLGLLALFVSRSLRIAIRSTDTFQRLLSIGLGVHLVGQSILIIGGNLRCCHSPVSPCHSYPTEASSLVVSIFELLCLLIISSRQEVSYAPNLKK